MVDLFDLQFCLIEFLWVFHYEIRVFRGDSRNVLLPEDNRTPECLEGKLIIATADRLDIVVCSANKGNDIQCRDGTGGKENKVSLDSMLVAFVPGGSGRLSLIDGIERNDVTLTYSALTSCTGRLLTNRARQSYRRESH